MWRGLVNAAIVLSVAVLVAFWLFTEPRLVTARVLGPHQPCLLYTSPSPRD